MYVCMYVRTYVCMYVNSDSVMIVATATVHRAYSVSF